MSLCDTAHKIVDQSVTNDRNCTINKRACVSTIRPYAAQMSATIRWSTPSTTTARARRPLTNPTTDHRFTTPTEFPPRRSNRLSAYIPMDTTSTVSLVLPTKLRARGTSVQQEQRHYCRRFWGSLPHTNKSTTGIILRSNTPKHLAVCCTCTFYFVAALQFLY